MSDKVLHVTKRDGNIVPFNLCRIVNAVIKAFQATKEVAPDEMNDKAEIIANEVFEVITNSDSTNLHINEIQKLVEKNTLKTLPRDSYRIHGLPS
ncbi:hypothetical protein HJ090_23695 [Vibrio parahaemolyticus]|nr:hypothetical protein [Vibrio parahaemolyticus]